MRTTDPEPTAGRPILGERVQAPAPTPPVLRQEPRGPSGIVTDEHGRLRTTTHPEK